MREGMMDHDIHDGSTHWRETKLFSTTRKQTSSALPVHSVMVAESHLFAWHAVVEVHIVDCCTHTDCLTHYFQDRSRSFKQLGAKAYKSSIHSIMMHAFFVVFPTCRASWRRRSPGRPNSDQPDITCGVPIYVYSIFLRALVNEECMRGSISLTGSW